MALEAVISLRNRNERGKVTSRILVKDFIDRFDTVNMKRELYNLVEQAIEGYVREKLGGYK